MTTTSYLTLDEADVLVPMLLTSGDERRTAWEASTEDDRRVCLVRASADLDACPWRGRRADSGQGGPWPRIDRGIAVGPVAGVAPVPVDPPEEIGVWSRPDVPHALRIATALQAAAHAARNAGFDAHRQTDADVQRGIVGRSGPGGSISIDAARAGTSAARLDPDAHAAIRSMLTTGGGLI